MGPPADQVTALVLPEDQLSPPLGDVTATVHYVRFRLTPDQVDLFAGGPDFLAVAHPAYEHGTELASAERAFFPAWTARIVSSSSRCKALFSR